MGRAKGEHWVESYRHEANSNMIALNAAGGVEGRHPNKQTFACGCVKEGVRNHTRIVRALSEAMRGGGPW